MEYLLSTRGALDHPVTRLTLAIAGSGIVLTPLIVAVLRGLGRVSPATLADVRVRLFTWLFLVPAVLAPLLLSPGSAMLLVTAISILCYREYARATGLFRCRLLSGLVAAGIVLLGAAGLDNWYNLFVALTPLTITVIAAAGVLADAPKGDIQRVALAVFAFLLFGSGFMHLAYLANDRGYRPILCVLLLGVQLSDVLAYVCGKALGRRRLFPNTSPNKTLEGHAGSLLIVAPFVAWLGHLVFRDSPMDRPLVLGAFGLMVAAGAQLGDLVVGSIKRDIGIKDMGAALPGHGGLLDRFNSLLLVAPAAFHFIAYFVGVVMDRPSHALLPP